MDELEKPGRTSSESPFPPTERQSSQPSTALLLRKRFRSSASVGGRRPRDASFRSEALISRRPNRRLVASASAGSGTQPLLVGERSARPDGYSAVRLVVDAGLRAMAIRDATATVPQSVPSRLTAIRPSRPIQRTDCSASSPNPVLVAPLASGAKAIVHSRADRARPARAKCRHSARQLAGVLLAKALVATD